MAEQGIMHPILGREYPTCVCPQPSGLIAKRAFSWWARSTITVRNDPQQGDGCPLSFEVLCSNRGGRGSARGCKREAIGPQARARAPRPGHKGPNQGSPLGASLLGVCPGPTRDKGFAIEFASHLLRAALTKRA